MRGNPHLQCTWDEKRIFNALARKTPLQCIGDETFSCNALATKKSYESHLPRKTWAQRKVHFQPIWEENHICSSFAKKTYLRRKLFWNVFVTKKTFATMYFRQNLRLLWKTHLERKDKKFVYNTFATNILICNAHVTKNVFATYWRIKTHLQPIDDKACDCNAFATKKSFSSQLRQKTYMRWKTYFEPFETKTYLQLIFEGKPFARHLWWKTHLRWKPPLCRKKLAAKHAFAI